MSGQVFTFAGAEEGIYCSMRTLVEPGDHVIVVEPCYQSLKSLPASFGGTISSIFLTFENDWQLELKDVETVIQANTKLIILNVPQTRPADLLSKEAFVEIIRLARRSGAYLFCDEVYRYLEIDENKRLPSVADAYEKGISLNVMTKSFGLAGLRIGWIASQDENFMNQVSSYKLYTSICNSAPSEILALIALRAKEHILKRNRNIILTNLKILDDFMERREDLLKWYRPQSGPTALMRLLLPISIDHFSQRLAEKEGILIMPGSVFDIPCNDFRVGFGRKNMPEIMERFETFLKEFSI